jgi:uncharacterized integral membrane protein
MDKCYEVEILCETVTNSVVCETDGVVESPNGTVLECEWSMDKCYEIKNDKNSQTLKFNLWWVFLIIGLLVLILIIVLCIYIVSKKRKKKKSEVEKKEAEVYLKFL